MWSGATNASELRTANCTDWADTSVGNATIGEPTRSTSKAFFTGQILRSCGLSSYLTCAEVQ